MCQWPTALYHNKSDSDSDSSRYRVSSVTRALYHHHHHRNIYSAQQRSQEIFSRESQILRFLGSPLVVCRGKVPVGVWGEAPISWRLDVGAKQRVLLGMRIWKWSLKPPPQYGCGLGQLPESFWNMTFKSVALVHFDSHQAVSYTHLTLPTILRV